VTVHASVLTDDESRRYFGASLADEGIQAIWLSVENGGDSRLRFYRSSPIRVTFLRPKSSSSFTHGGEESPMR